MQNNFLYLVWRNPLSNHKYIIGKLIHGSTYRFEYSEEDGTMGVDWQPLVAFPERRVYESEILFPVFSSRIPDRKRRDIQKILDKYGLKEFDEFELPIDTYEFLDSN